MVRPTPPSAPTSIGIAAGAHSPSTPTKAAPSSFNLMHPSPLNHVSISGANARPTAPPVNRHNIHTSTSASASIARHGVAPVQQLNPTPRPQGSVMSAYPQYTHQGAVSTPTKRPFDSVDINDPHGRFSSKPKIERKFPGPAGALPKLSDNEKNIMFKSRSPVKAPTPDGKKVVDLIRNGLSRNSSFGLSRLAFSTGPEQGYDEDFEMESWRAMLQGRPGYDVRRDGIATLGQRPAGRVDRLIVLIKEVKQSEAETGVTVKDPFGEVQGTIDKSALDLYRDNFAVGVALELQQVPLFKPSSRSVHLIIRQENLVCFRLPNGVALHTQ
ncbi:uncharacterized protein BJ171DRAFT_514067 [Polychytrium aggregatum]|uniref:uncharacterized protein n=1 Tax=Polychytrium aggregatum TaxID=110093 RepID=UPI0022FE60D5|nr:uncharacterized protein BJ171DRAFT_514067 [Polychytrium aggregatum]KAI9202441.1 hypothetical protein BJ171DRAFT_514067 [Polychytrium aggregatum]